MSQKQKSRAGKPEEGEAEVCFIIMPYGGPFDRYYENIYAPAVRDAGLEPKRADSIFASGAILADIWHFTKRAKILLADMSGHNPNVFYELGLAHAIAKPVVLVAPSIEDVPFDLRGLRVITYNKDNETWGNDLRKDIQKALTETLADVRRAVPPTFLDAAPRTETPQEEPILLELRRLQDAVRAVQASLPETKRYVPVPADDSKQERLMDAINYLSRYIGTMLPGRYTAIRTALESGQKLLITAELARAGLPSKIAAELASEALLMMQSPKDELLRTDRGEG
jgi:hypothetical protein